MNIKSFRIAQSQYSNWPTPDVEVINEKKEEIWLRPKSQSHASIENSSVESINQTTWMTNI